MSSTSLKRKLAQLISRSSDFTPPTPQSDQAYDWRGPCTGMARAALLLQLEQDYPPEGQSS